MNDPFDSMIGYSVEDIYEECISMLLEAFHFEGNLKIIMSYLMKYRAFAKLGDLISEINELKRYLNSKQREMHQVNISFQHFVQNNVRVLYSKLPQRLKKSFSEKAFSAFAGMIVQLSEVEITAENITELLEIDDALKGLEVLASNLRQEVFEPAIKDLLSKTTISCFSTSGWNNQLMWAHYANSYSGFCIEYDFSKISNYIGQICQVKYSQTRPHLTLRDIGIAGYDEAAVDKTVHCDVDLQAIFSKLLVKNNCWKYEEEWRIINFGEENTPIFINLPFISSITFGINMDPICKMMVMDVCKLRGISCFQLSIDSANYQLHREKIDIDNIVYSPAEDMELIEVLSNHFVSASKVLVADCDALNNAIENNRIEYLVLSETLEKAEDLLCDVYTLKNTLIRLFNQSKAEADNYSLSEEEQNTFSGINHMVSTIRDSSDKLYGPVLLHTAQGKIPFNQADKIGKQISNLINLAKKVDEVSWPFCIMQTGPENRQD